MVKDSRLPFACAWPRCVHSSSVGLGNNSNRIYNDSCLSCKAELVVSLGTTWFYDYVLLSFCWLASWHQPVKLGHGLVGKTFLSHIPYLCRDVTQLGQSDYPMAPSVRECAFTCCFAICLQIIATGNCDYVLEFYLPCSKTYSGNIHNRLSSLLVTLKQHLESFDLVTGDSSDELFIEVDKYSINSVIESFETCTPGTIQIESGEVVQVDISRHPLGLEESVENGGNFVDLERRQIDANLGEKVQEADISGHRLGMKESIENGGNFVDLEQNQIYADLDKKVEEADISRHRIGHGEIYRQRRQFC